MYQTAAGKNTDGTSPVNNGTTTANYCNNSQRSSVGELQMRGLPVSSDGPTQIVEHVTSLFLRDLRSGLDPTIRLTVTSELPGRSRVFASWQGREIEISTYFGENEGEVGETLVFELLESELFDEKAIWPNCPREHEQSHLLVVRALGQNPYWWCTMDKVSVAKLGHLYTKGSKWADTDEVK